MESESTARRVLDVGLLIDRWEPRRGGAERALAALARHLLARGHRLRVFAERADADAPGEFVRVPARGWTREARARHLAGALPDAAEAAGCGVTLGIRHLRRVDLYWPHDGAHAASLAARREARGRPADAPPTGRHALFCALERELLAGGRARRVVCVSELVRDELAARYPSAAERLVVIDNGVDLARFSPERRAELGPPLRRRLGVAPATPLIAFAGADGRRKGLLELLAALATLTERPWILLAAGVRHPGAWRRSARGLGLSAGRVMFTPSLDAAELWAAADLCALPTWRDTCGLVVLEALASGVPVLTTRRAGAATCLGDARTGRVVARPDPGALALALGELLEAPGVERSVLRAAVRLRDERAWLSALEQALHLPGG